MPASGGRYSGDAQDYRTYPDPNSPTNLNKPHKGLGAKRRGRLARRGNSMLQINSEAP